MIRAGTLDRRITIVPAPQAAAFSVWAKVTETGGREGVEVGQLTGERTATFLIRWRAGIDEVSRITWDGQDWSVIAYRQLGRREGLELTGRARR